MPLIFLFWSFCLFGSYITASDESSINANIIAEAAADYYYTAKEYKDRAGMIEAIEMMMEDLKTHLSLDTLQKLLDAFEDWDKVVENCNLLFAANRSLRKREKFSELWTPLYRSPNDGAACLRHPYMHF